MGIIISTFIEKMTYFQGITSVCPFKTLRALLKFKE